MATLRPCPRSARALPILLGAAALAGALAAPQGLRLARAEDDAPTAPAKAPKTPDYEFYKQKVAPIVEKLCMECHANPRRRNDVGRHWLRPAWINGKLSHRIREQDQRDNYETVLKLITPGDPSKSIWLLKPLTESQGGVPHKGGVRFRIDGIEYATFIQFIDGVKAEKPPETGTPAEKIPEVGGDGLRLPAEDMERDGDATTATPEGAEGSVVVPGGEVVSLSARFRATADAVHEIRFRTLGGPGAFRFRIDGGYATPVEVRDAGFSWVGPMVPCDGADPLADRRGSMRVDGEALRMEGTSGSAASWLAPTDVEYDGVEARVRPASEEDGGDDAIVLFDMKDDANGRYAGLVDGGRRLAMGYLEGGALRALATAETPPAPKEAAGVRAIRVSYEAGIAVVRLDGRALLTVNLPDRPKGGGFGALSHGVLTVDRLAVSAQYEVHRVNFAEHPFLPLSAGEHELTIEAGPGGPSLDTVQITLSAP